MKIWVLSTCVPNDPEPCWPRVFTKETDAEAAFKEVMQSEWDNAGIEDDDGNKLPCPDDAQEAHDTIKDHYLNCSSELWGQWEITTHEIAVSDIIVKVEGGMVQDVTVPDGVKVIVRDYDTANTLYAENDELPPEHTDADGKHYSEQIWEHQS